MLRNKKNHPQLSVWNSQVLDEIIPSEAGCYWRFATTQYVKLNIPGINHSLVDQRKYFVSEETTENIAQYF